METPPTSYRLTPECRRLIRDIGKTLGLKGAAVIELAVRRLAAVELASEGRPAEKPKWKR